MKNLLLGVFAFTATTIAAPSPDVALNRTNLPSSVLNQCEQAPNCETFEGPHGLAIRFKAGMEPGSADYIKRFQNITDLHSLVKRYTQTRVTMGKTSMMYYTTNPCDALHHCLYDYCQSWTKHDWCIRTKEGDDCGTQWWGEQTNFISVNKFYNGNLRGFIQAQVSLDGESSNWCARGAGVLGAIAGAINPIAGGFFGAVNALCS